MARQYRSQQTWQTLINKQPNSGLSIRQFCEQHQITQSNFYYWRKRLSDVSEDDTNESAWLELPTVAQQTEDWMIELALPGGVTLKMRSA